MEAFAFLGHKLESQLVALNGLYMEAFDFVGRKLESPALKYVPLISDAPHYI